MKRITLYYNGGCSKCGRIARFHRIFDWLNRLELSTAPSPIGPLKPGQFAVLDHTTGETGQGAAAMRHIFRNVPVYLPLLPLLWLPTVAWAIDRKACICTDGCAMPGPVQEPL